jgi:hypothetical protein
MERLETVKSHLPLHDCPTDDGGSTSERQAFRKHRRVWQAVNMIKVGFSKLMNNAHPQDM